MLAHGSRLAADRPQRVAASGHHARHAARRAALIVRQAEPETATASVVQVEAIDPAKQAPTQFSYKTDEFLRTALLQNKVRLLGLIVCHGDSGEESPGAPRPVPGRRL